ncbi:MAG: hypothetical protein P4L51_07120 [Puia sp.]|nr:hypothetical protein [Puia sp.]
MRKVLYISRSVLFLILALQVLNLSIASQTYWDNAYDYSYAYNSKYDPTETAVEWIVEMNCGQQSAFNYNDRTDTNKNTFKSLHWQIGLEEVRLPVRQVSEAKNCHFARPAGRLPSPTTAGFSPPPEQSNG